jgi:hypothetical protein
MRLSPIQISYKGGEENILSRPNWPPPKLQREQIISATLSNSSSSDSVIDTRRLAQELKARGLHSFDFSNQLTTTAESFETDAPSRVESLLDHISPDSESLDDSQDSRDGNGNPPDDRSPELLEFQNPSLNPKRSKNLLWASTVSFFASILLAFGVHSKEEVCGIYTKFLRLPSALATITLGAVTLSEWLRASPQTMNLNLIAPQNGKFEEVTYAPG